MNHHILKTHPDPFQAIWNGVKRAEFRKNDRDFTVGDTLYLREFIPDSSRYTGRRILAKVLHMTAGFGIPSGYVMMSIEPLEFLEPTHRDST